MDPTQASLQDLQTAQQGDIGVSIIVAVTDPDGFPVNLRTATSLTIRLQMPDQTTKNFTAVFLTDGSDGQIVYVTQTGDLSQAGEYGVQGIVVINAITKYTAVGIIRILSTIPAPSV